MKRIKYGHVIQSEPIDENRRKMVKSTFVAGDEVSRFVSYEERIPIKDLTHEVAMYMKFREEHPYVEGCKTRLEGSKRGTEQYYLVVTWEERQ